MFLTGPASPSVSGPGDPGAGVSGPAGPSDSGAGGPGAGVGVSGPAGPDDSVPGRCEQRQFSAVSHGAPAPPRLGLFSG